MLGVDRVDGDAVRVTGPDGALIAEARPTTVDAAEVVHAVGPAEAASAAERYLGFQSHPFPTCFVCGPRRPDHDGLGVYPGRLDDGRTAATFRAPDHVDLATVWAALDCPGGWTVPQDERPHVLGREAVRVEAFPSPGEECVVIGLRTGADGRKAFTLTTLYGSAGTVLATARSTWIAI